MKVWVDDTVFVMDRLQSLNGDPSSRFYESLDFSHIELFGHSFGGGIAIPVFELDARCKAAADLDGTLFSDESVAAIQQPILFMTEDQCGKNCNTMNKVYSNASEPAYLFPLKRRSISTSAIFPCG